MKKLRKVLSIMLTFCLLLCVQTVTAKANERQYTCNNEEHVHSNRCYYGGDVVAIDFGTSNQTTYPSLAAAVEYAIECGNISISALQRRFKVGYARAGRLIDSMELKGVVEASQGAKARKVLMTREQFWSMYDERLD